DRSARAQVQIVCGQVRRVKRCEVVKPYQRSGLQSQLQHSVAGIPAAGIQVKSAVASGEVDVSGRIGSRTISTLPDCACALVRAGAENGYLVQDAGALRAIGKQPAVVRKFVAVRAIGDVNVA